MTIVAGPCTIVQVKNTEKDGYNAVQLGFGDVKERRVNKPTKDTLIRQMYHTKDI